LGGGGGKEAQFRHASRNFLVGYNNGQTVFTFYLDCDCYI